MPPRAAALVCCLILTPVPGCSKIAEEAGKSAARQAMSAVTTPLYVDPPAKPGCPIPAGGPSVTATATDRDLRVAVPIPNGWTAPDSGTPDLTGPDGMTATVRLTATEQDADGAFAAHLDAVTTSLGGGELHAQDSTLCGFSGRRISGSSARQVVAERIAYIPTGSGGYLAVVHLEGPADTFALGPAKAALLNDVVIAVL